MVIFTVHPAHVLFGLVNLRACEGIGCWVRARTYPRSSVGRCLMSWQPNPASGRPLWRENAKKPRPGPDSADCSHPSFEVSGASQLTCRRGDNGSKYFRVLLRRGKVPPCRTRVWDLGGARRPPARPRACSSRVRALPPCPTGMGPDSGAKCPLVHTTPPARCPP